MVVIIIIIIIIVVIHFFVVVVSHVFALCRLEQLLLLRCILIHQLARSVLGRDVLCWQNIIHFTAVMSVSTGVTLKNHSCHNLCKK